MAVKSFFISTLFVLMCAFELAIPYYIGKAFICSLLKHDLTDYPGLIWITGMAMMAIGVVISVLVSLMFGANLLLSILLFS